MSQLEIKVGDVWFEKTTRRPLCIVSIHPNQKLVFVTGLSPEHSVTSFEDLRKNAIRGEGWGRTSLFEGIITKA